MRLWSLRSSISALGLIPVWCVYVMAWLLPSSPSMSITD